MPTLVPVAFSLPENSFLTSSMSIQGSWRLIASWVRSCLLSQRERARSLPFRGRVREKFHVQKSLASQSYFFLPFFFRLPPLRDRLVASRACFDCARLASLEMALPWDESRID